MFTNLLKVKFKMRINKNVLITESVELWRVIEGAAQFEQVAYDKAFKDSIKNTLLIPEDISILDFLSENSIAVEQLIYALLNALEPFAVMMTDLLNMFELAGAQRGDNNISIQLNFDNMKNSFNFNLEHFKQEVVMIEKVTTSLNVFIIDNPWVLIYPFKNESDIYTRIEPKSDEIIRWIFEYMEKDIWPEFIPRLPLTNIKCLDDNVLKLWNIWRYSVNEYKKHYDENIGRRQSLREVLNNKKNSTFWFAETDLWTCSFLRKSCIALEKINTLQNETKLINAEKLSGRIDGLISNLKVEKRNFQYEIKYIIEILNLPIWKKRYELYSAWVSTQIIDALNSKSIVFHVKENTLSFSFKGSHIATFTGVNPPLQLWAELRTKHKNPISKKRKKHIQPDYTLAIDSPYSPENSVVVVECKQYKKSNRKNFTEAIIDYANGRPNSSMMLVNYGPITDKLFDVIDSSVSKRSTAYEYLQPNAKSTKEFKRNIFAATEYWYLSNGYKFNVDEVDFPLRVKLKWKNIPRDLDLHLVVRELLGNAYHISYSNKGNLSTKPYAILDKDMTDGWGEETITIHKPLDAEYDIFIHNYSGEKIEELNATISIISDLYVKEVECKKVCDRNQYWHAFRIKKSCVEVIDEIKNKDSFNMYKVI